MRLLNSLCLNAENCFASRHRKHIHMITWSQLNHPSFSQESAVCTKQDIGRVYSMLPSVTTYSSFTKSVVMSVAVSKVGVVLCQASNEKSVVSIGGISYYLNNIEHGVNNNTQQLLCKTDNFMSSELWPPIGQSWTQLITRYRESPQPPPDLWGHRHCSLYASSMTLVLAPKISPVQDWWSTLFNWRFWQLPSSKSRDTKTRINIKNLAWSKLDIVL